MEKLKIEDLNYQEILKNVTLDVMEERLTMIAGTNGSGKTTLLKLLAGLLKSDGEITYKDVNEPELFCKVGLLSGDHGHMHEAKSVEETLQKTLLDHNKTTKNVMSIQKRVVKLCNLDNILHQSLRDLNAFDLQKLRLAQLLCQKKELF